MKKLLVLLVLLGAVSFQALANPQRVISSLAVSSKGQYVVLEEFGYKEETNSFYSKVKMFNSWKNVYEGEEINLEANADYPLKLNEIRNQVKLIAMEKYKSYALKF